MTAFKDLILAVVDNLDGPFTLRTVRSVVIIVTGEDDTPTLDHKIRYHLQNNANLDFTKRGRGNAIIYTKPNS